MLLSFHRRKTCTLTIRLSACATAKRCTYLFLRMIYCHFCCCCYLLSQSEARKISPRVTTILDAVPPGPVASIITRSVKLPRRKIESDERRHPTIETAAAMTTRTPMRGEAKKKMKNIYLASALLVSAYGSGGGVSGSRLIDAQWHSLRSFRLLFAFRIIELIHAYSFQSSMSRLCIARTRIVKK